MELLIVTGTSGAGKTVALKTLEDIGYYCVDNLPVFLIEQFAVLCKQNTEYSRFAVGVDIRSGRDLAMLPEVLEHLHQNNIKMAILFLDADDEVLIKRFKETRRSHPLAKQSRVEDGIRKERESLSFIRGKADYVVDTSTLLTRDLRQQLMRLFSGDQVFKNMVITVMSFGFKYGIPQDADLVMDVRFLPNPYYDLSLREKTGLDPEIRDYVLNNETAGSFLQKLYDMIDFLLPNYLSEGKNQLVIAFGCTGGKHRSVAVAETLYQRLKTDGGYIVKSIHRDIELK